MIRCRIDLFKTSIIEVEDEYAKEQSGCSCLDDFDALSFVDKDGGICVWFNGKPKLETIAHESVHLANLVIERAGLFYSSKEDELLAYLVGYIFEKLRSED